MTEPTNDPFAVPPQGGPAVPPLPPVAPAPPPYGEPLRGPARNGLGTAALILGIASLPFGILLLLPVLAIVLGLVAMRRAKRGEATNRGVALAGTICGVLGLLGGIGFIALAISIYNSPSGKQYRECERSAVTSADHQRCSDDLGKNLFK